MLHHLLPAHVNSKKQCLLRIVGSIARVCCCLRRQVAKGWAEACCATYGLSKLYSERSLSVWAMNMQVKNPAPIHVILGEVQNVVAAMRVNSRWASSSRLVRYLVIFLLLESLTYHLSLRRRTPKALYCKDSKIWAPHSTKLQVCWLAKEKLRISDPLSITMLPIDISELDTLTYLKPFLAVIRSEETSGPITGVALSSIHKFLSYGFIRK